MTTDGRAAFHVRGHYVTLAWGLPTGGEVLRRFTPYARYERRRAWFEGFVPVKVERVTLGARFDLWETVAFKAELLLNREIAGAPTVDNDVVAASLVWSW